MTAPTDDEYDQDTEMLAAAVTALEGALAAIDNPNRSMPPGEQLATLAVAGVRALVPLLRDEVDRRQA